MQHPLVLDTTVKFGRLTPIRSLGPQTDSRKRRMWEFRCDCGTIVERSASTVNTGRTKSCGCLQVEYRQASIKPTVKPDLAGPRRKLFGRYRREAKNRGYIFELTFDHFSEIICQDCFYCGAKPSTTLNISTVFEDRNVLTYNGIDRAVNSIGYTIINSVPCCGVCNRIKMAMDMDDFVTQVKKIAAYLEKKNEV